VNRSLEPTHSAAVDRQANRGALEAVAQPYRTTAAPMPYHGAVCDTGRGPPADPMEIPIELS
jgi:hypothetical protein